VDFHRTKLCFMALHREFRRDCGFARPSCGNQISSFELGARRSSKMSIFIFISSFSVRFCLILAWLSSCVSGLECVCWILLLKLIQKYCSDCLESIPWLKCLALCFLPFQCMSIRFNFVFLPSFQFYNLCFVCSPCSIFIRVISSCDCMSSEFAIRSLANCLQC